MSVIPFLETGLELLKMMATGAIGTGIYGISGYFKNHTYEFVEWDRLLKMAGIGALVGLFAFTFSIELTTASAVFMAIIAKNVTAGGIDFLDNISRFGFKDALNQFKP